MQNTNKGASASLYAQIGLLAIAFGLLFHTAISELIYDWSHDDNFSHGFLIPFISGYMIWNSRDRLNRDDIRPSYFGLAVIGLGMAVHILGTVGSELFIMRFAMIITLLGLSLFLFGAKITRKVLIPILYLIFMIPIPAIIWNKISFPLQLFAAKLTAQFLQGVGLTILREGNILHLPNVTLEVVDACSGLRSLTSLLALSGAFAYLAPLKNISKLILFLSAVPIAILVNIFRLTVTAFMARWIGSQAAQGFLHDFSGIFIFIIAFLLVFAAYWGLSKFEPQRNAGAGSAG